MSFNLPPGVTGKMIDDLCGPTLECSRCGENITEEWEDEIPDDSRDLVCRVCANDWTFAGEDVRTMLLCAETLKNDSTLDETQRKRAELIYKTLDREKWEG